MAADWTMALVTVALVAVTAWYAHLTKRISDASHKAARAALRTAEAAERHTLLSLRPDPMPDPRVRSKPNVDDPGGTGVAPRYAPTNFETDLRNVGLGPALDIQATLLLDGEVEKPRSEHFQTGGYLSVDSKPVKMLFVFGDEATARWLEAAPGGKLVITYKDVFGGEWEAQWSVAYWNEEFSMGPRQIVKSPWGEPGAR